MAPIITPIVTRRRLLGLCAAALGSVVLGACGGAASGAGDKSQTAGGFSNEVVAQRIAVSTMPDGTLRWDSAVYRAQAGDVTFVVRNPSPVQHRFGVEGQGVNAHGSDLLTGKTGNYTLKGLQAGEYTIVCDYPGHRVAGMLAKLIVA